MRFLLDENLPRSIGNVLKQHEHDVLEVAESPLRGSPDTTLWLEAHRQERILVSRDLDFPLPNIRPNPPGLVLIRAPDTFSSANLAALVDGFLRAIDPNELLGRITVVAPGRVRSRRLQ